MSTKRKARRYSDEEMDMDEDAREGNPYSRRRKKKSTFLKIPRWVYKILLILVVCVLGLLIWFNRENLTPSNVAEWVQDQVVGFGVGDGYPAPISGENVALGNFASMNQDAVVVSDTSLTILNSTAKQMVNRQHSFGNPVMRVRNSRILIYNLGGTGYQIESHAKTIVKSNTDQDIMAGDVASNGRYVLVTKTKGYCSQLTAYLNDNKKQYQYNFSEYYVTGVSLNKEGTKAAVCAISAKDGGMSSAIYLFDFSNPKPTAVLTCNDNMLISITYADNGTITAIGEKGISIVREGADSKTDFSYEGQQLSAFAVDAGRTVLALSPYENSVQSKLVVLGNTGKTTASVAVNQRIKSVALYGDTAAALAGNKVYAYSAASGRNIGSCDAGSDAAAIALHNEGSAFILGVSEIRLASFK